MGAAAASGENRAIEAAQKAISSPLLEDISIQGARGVLINITGRPRSVLARGNEAASMIQEEAHDEANIIFGAVIDETMTDEIRITVIATGFGEVKEEKKACACTSANPVRQRFEHRQRGTEESQGRSSWHHCRRSRHTDVAAQKGRQRGDRNRDIG
jgi:cell division protein FtsZ